MDPVYIYIAIGGLLVGGLIAWFAAGSQSAVIRGRLNAKEDEVGSLNDRISQMNLKIDGLNAETRKLAAAEAEAARVAELDKENERIQNELSRLKSDHAVLKKEIEKERESAKEQRKFIEDAKKLLEDTFKALSSDALKSNNEQFLKLARANLEKYQSEAKGDLTERQKAIETLVHPLKENLDKYQALMANMGKERSGQYTSLADQLKALITSEKLLRDETGKLVNALSAPKVRGNWGELTLRRVVELAGMVERCDFVEQESVKTEKGLLRPDMIINMPDNRRIVVDAKAPLKAYVEAVEAANEEDRKAKLRLFATHVKARVQELSKKEYWDQFPEAPEYVVLFLPGEQFLGAALQEEPELLEIAFKQKVIPATPTTLISLMKAVAYGWRQEALTVNAKQISELGSQLYERIATLTGHFQDLGRNIDKSVESYNRAIGSLERRVIVSARKLKELGATAADDIESLEPVDQQTRHAISLGHDIEEPDDKPPALA